MRRTLFASSLPVSPRVGLPCQAAKRGFAPSQLSDERGWRVAIERVEPLAPFHPLVDIKSARFASFVFTEGPSR
jgi:hypothetical protein